MADLTLNDNQTGRNIDPSLRIGDISGDRYPNPFFDMAQQYMPPTIKELFRWCTFYYYNSPLIGAAITKISRYPITDLIFDDVHESVRDVWDNIFNKDLKIKDRLMEVNLDYHVYGNAFVSIHLPFTRFLVCATEGCGYRAPINQWDWKFAPGNYSFSALCPKCGILSQLKVHDVPYKDKKGIRIIRWNPENIMVKFNEYTGRRIYMYSVPPKLRNAVLRGDKDILEDIPLIVIEAVKSRKMIRFDTDNLIHLKRPTLAEQDQGWGKPLIIHVLKDMFYLYTLRRAQEAIALEHVVPFDIIFPLPNAQQDPYLHTDLANWRLNIEHIIRRHRRDPNFKGVIPIPVGFGRLGGDGKAMLLTPEINILTQQIVGGMGIPQEFLFGGLNFTGSSISLRTLENDFVQNRSQLLDLIFWIKDKIRVWLNLPDIRDVRFADFRMADDVQRNQQLIGLNAQSKVSDQTMLTELGYDYEQEAKKMIEEVYFRNFLNDLIAKGSAKSQGEASIIQMNYQNKIQELAQKAQASAMEKAQQLGLPVPGQEPGAPTMDTGNAPAEGAGPGPDQGASAGGAGGWQQALPAPGGDPTAQSPGGQPGSYAGGAQAPVNVNDELQRRVASWAHQLLQAEPNQAAQALMELKAKMPDIGQAVEKEYKMLKAQATMGGGGRSHNNPNSVQPNMNPLPQKGAPTRAGVV